MSFRRGRPFDDHHGPPPATFVGSCRGKTRFRSKKQARGWRRVIVEKRGAHPELTGVYKCHACGGWHIGASERHREENRRRNRNRYGPQPRAPALVERLVAAIAWFGHDRAHPTGQSGERSETMQKGEAPRTGNNGAAAVRDPATLEVLPALPVGMDPRTRSEIAEQIRIAREFPRDVRGALKQAEDLALLDDETAASCYYTLKRRDSDTGENKPIEGPSVRLAEIVVLAWGHLFVAAGQAGMTDRFVTARGAVWDMQTNNRYMFEQMRRITKRNGQTYNDDMIQTTSNAAMSIALRNAIFKVVPSPFWRPIYVKCRNIAMGSDDQVPQNFKKALAYFEEEWKLSEAHLLAWLDIRSLKELQKVHIGRLRGLATAIRDGDTTVDDAFADVSIVQMPQRQSTTPAAPIAPTPDPEPERQDLVITRLQKKETTAKPAANGSPAQLPRVYWVAEFSDRRQGLTFSTTLGAQLEELDMARRAGHPTPLQAVDMHTAGDWTYIDTVKPAVLA